MPVTIPDNQKPLINSQTLNNYYESLVSILNNYIDAHKKEPRDDNQSKKSL